MEIGISLGSNLGDRLANLVRARAELAAIPGTRICVSAPVYETEPVDVVGEYADKAFLNTIVIIETELDAHRIEDWLHSIEARIGRVRGADRNAPRPIDLDIIYAGALVIGGGHLIVPHERWSERRFVVQPLADVRPDLVIPGQSCSVARLLLSLPATPRVVLFRQEW